MAAIPMFPLAAVLLPGRLLPLRIFEPRYRTMIREVLDTPEPRFGVVLIERGSEIGGGEVRCEVGTIAKVIGHDELPDGRFTVLCRGTDRIRVTRWLPDAPYPRAEVEQWPDGNADQDAWTAAVMRVEQAARRVRNAHESSMTHGHDDEATRHQRILELPSAKLAPTDYTFGMSGALPISESDRYRALIAADPLARANVLVDAAEDAAAAIEFLSR